MQEVNPNLLPYSDMLHFLTATIYTKSTQVSETNNNKIRVRLGYADLQFRKIK